MSQVQDLLRAAYLAFNERDIDHALALMTDDVTWPKASEGGYVEGKEAIRAYFRRQWSEFDPRVEPLVIEEQDDGDALATVHQIVKDLRGSILSDSEVHHRFTLRDGLIAGMTLQASADGPTSAFVKRTTD